MLVEHVRQLRVCESWSCILGKVGPCRHLIEVFYGHDCWMLVGDSRQISQLVLASLQRRQLISSEVVLVGGRTKCAMHCLS